MVSERPNFRRGSLALLSLLAALLLLRVRGPHYGSGDPDREFVPVLLGAEFAPSRVRPGEELGYSLRFVNQGTQPAKGSHRVFVHFESVDRPQDCSQLTWQDDHDPLEPTRRWLPGVPVEDGPYAMRVPADAPEGEYRVHVGLFSFENTGWRKLDADAGRIWISSSAPPSVEWHPEPLPVEVIRAREAELARTPARSVRLPLGGDAFLEVDLVGGGWVLADGTTDARWLSHPDRDRLLTLLLRRDAERAEVSTARLQVAGATEDMLELKGALVSLEGREYGQFLWRAQRFGLEAVPGDREAPEPASVRISARAELAPGWEVEELRLLDRSLATWDQAQGVVLMPVRMGQALPTDKGRPSRREYGTYDDLSMAMFGVLQGDGAILCSWEHPSARVRCHLAVENHPAIPGRRVRTQSWIVQGPEASLDLHVLGAGDGDRIAWAYRRVARARGFLPADPEGGEGVQLAERLRGAVYFKPCFLEYHGPMTPFNPTERPKWIRHGTFAEAGTRMEWMRRELGVERALVVLAGWNRGGYDNQLPRVFPAPVGLGGNSGLQRLVLGLRALGFVVGAHDNYQDMYPNSPDWDPAVLNRGPDGNPKSSGQWAGGVAALVCTSQQARYAERNLREFQSLSPLDVAFVDAGFAWPLVTCEDPSHPMDRQQDLGHKLELLEIARREVGAVGCEGGREMVVQKALFFEGLAAPNEVDPVWNRRVPLFQMVFGGAVALYPSMFHGDRVGVDGIERFLGLLVQGGAPFYEPAISWTMGRGPSELVPLELDAQPAGDPDSRLWSLEWRVRGPIPSGLVAFLHVAPAGETGEREPLAARHLALSEALGAQPEPSDGPVQSDPLDWPEASELGDGAYDLWGGVLQDGRRLTLLGRSADHGRHLLGRLEVQGGVWRFEAAAPLRNLRALARADGGWAEEYNDPARLVKNTYEVATWAVREAAPWPLTEHRFLDPAGRTESARFGEVRVVVHRGDEPFTCGETVLAPRGFLVRSPTFLAVHALAHGPARFQGGALWTLRSLDGAPLEASHRVAVYRGFGSGPIPLWGDLHPVGREAVLTR